MKRNLHEGHVWHINIMIIHFGAADIKPFCLQSLGDKSFKLLHVDVRESFVYRTINSLDHRQLLFFYFECYTKGNDTSNNNTCKFLVLLNTSKFLAVPYTGKLCPIVVRCALCLRLVICVLCLIQVNFVLA